MSYWEARRLTELYKKMAGLPYKEVPNELIAAEKAVADMKSRIAARKAAGAEEKEITELMGTLATLEYRYRQLMIQWEKKPYGT